MIEKNADNGPDPYASLYNPREDSRIVNEIEIRNKERQKYQNSLLHALPLKFLQFIKTEINDSLIFIKLFIYNLIYTYYSYFKRGS